MFQDVLSTLDWLASAQGINGLFAVLCFAAALGGSPRLVMLLSALLYAALMAM